MQAFVWSLLTKSYHWTVETTFIGLPNGRRDSVCQSWDIGWQLTQVNTFAICCVWIRKTNGKYVLYADTKTQHTRDGDIHKVRARVTIVYKHWRVDCCVSLYIVAHCVSGLSVALWDMRTADVTMSAVGWDFTGFLWFFCHAGDWRSEKCTGFRHYATHPDIPRRLSYVWNYIVRTINPLWTLFYGSAFIILHTRSTKSG